MTYYSIDDILASNEKIPCCFKQDVPGYGFLSRAGDAVLLKSVMIELPHDMASKLASKDLIDMVEPVCFSKRVRSDLDASPMSVDCSSY